MVADLGLCNLQLRLRTIWIFPRLSQPKCLQNNAETLSTAIATATAAAVYVRNLFKSLKSYLFCDDLIGKLFL